jgi:hypothetical protein
MRWRGVRRSEGAPGGLGRLSFGFGFEWSKAWAGYDRPWPVIFVLVGGFAVKMGTLFCLYLTSHN